MTNPELVRLNKFIADCGVASRRKAEEFIKKGLVVVNGRQVYKLATLVNPRSDKVEISGRKISCKKIKNYILLNKPAGYITTVKDTHNRKTVYNLLPGLTERLFPVGRLDKDTRGLLLLSDDGELAFRLTHPRFEVVKTYHVLVEGDLKSKGLYVIKKGVVIDGKRHFLRQVKAIYQSKRQTRFLVKLIEGKKRQIRITFEQSGFKVIDLKRIAIGNIQLGSLKEGESRHLSKTEVGYLKKITKLDPFSMRN